MVCLILAEGFECQALARSSRFLSTVHVPYIFMEWRKMFDARHHANTPCTAPAMQRLTDMLSDRGYVPLETHTGFQLNPARSTTAWKVGDLYWKHKTAEPLQDPY